MDLQPYIERLKREKEKEKKLTEERRERALRAARHIATLLKDSYGAKQVFLFGSVLKKNTYISSWRILRSF